MSAKSKIYQLTRDNFHATLEKEADLYVATCVEKVLASQGQTKKLALQNLDEALSLLLDEEISELPPKIKSRTLPFAYA